MANRMQRAISQDSDFDYFNVWKAAIEERTGVQITPDRERALALLLERRIKQLDPGDIDQYMSDALDIAKGAEEWAGLVDSLLIKETSFFRHRPSMEYVQAWVEQGVEENLFSQPLWIWSLGCSTGEEAYSLAIVIDQALRARGREPRFGIIGTDISREAIFRRAGRSTGKAGWHPSHRRRGLILTRLATDCGESRRICVDESVF